MRVIITGSSGQDGRILSEICKSRGSDVLPLTRGSFVLNQSAQEYVNPTFWISLIRDFEPTHIIHLASAHGPAGTMAKNWRADRNIYDVGVGTITALIEAVNRTDPSLKLIAASSSRIFTPDKSIDFKNEKSSMAPQDFYGQVKARMREQMVGARLHGLHASTAILFNHYSRFSKPGYLGDVLAEKITEAIRSNSFRLNVERPFAMGDFSDAEDICEGIYQIMKLDSPEDFVLGNGQAKNVVKIVQEISEELKIGLELETHEQKSIYPAPKCNIADTSKANQILAWNPSSSYASAVVKKIHQDLDSDY